MLLAVSGGSDSMGLFHLFCNVAKRYGLVLSILHLNHKLRKSASDNDATFVKMQARQFGVACSIKEVDIQRCRRSDESVEMAARRLRYQRLIEEAQALNAKAILTGHTADDQAETVLMRLLRGCALRGAGGIRMHSVRAGMRLWRPLLCFSRIDIRKWLKDHNFQWIEDESNQSESYQRNLIRHRVLPQIRERVNQGASNNLVRFSQYAREDEAFIMDCARMQANQMGLDPEKPTLSCSLLQGQSPALVRRWLSFWLERRAPDGNWRRSSTFDALVAMIATEADGAWNLSDDLTIIKQGDTLAIKQKQACPSPFCSRAAVPGRTVMTERQLTVSVTQGKGIYSDRTDAPGQLPARASLRRLTEVEAGSLFVRSIQPGDRIAPLGMSGTRKLQDILTDLKVSSAERKQLPVLVCGEEIIWVPGYRIARGWSVPDRAAEATQVVIEPLGSGCQASRYA